MKITGQKLALTYLIQGFSNQRLSPSLLFIGPEESGRRSTAIELAKVFVCKNTESKSDDFQRCDECSSCQKIRDNNHPDFLIIDRKSQAIIIKEKAETQTAIKIESIRYLDKFLRLLPTESQRRFVIIDEANKMTIDAANALLKILEEPPPMAQIVLISKDTKSLPATIASRCAVVRFLPRPLKDLPALEPLNIADYELDEFFELIANTNWRREGRKHAEEALSRILAPFQKKWDEGDLSQEANIKAVLAARRQIDRNVAPRLVLENLYLELFPQ